MAECPRPAVKGKRIQQLLRPTWQGHSHACRGQAEWEWEASSHPHSDGMARRVSSPSPPSALSLLGGPAPFPSPELAEPRQHISQLP